MWHKPRVMTAVSDLLFLAGAAALLVAAVVWGTPRLRLFPLHEIQVTHTLQEVRQSDGRWYVLELPLMADFAIVKAWKGDRFGNLVYRKTARNFNPIMATAGRITIAEVEQLVEPGQIDPDQVHTPGVYVQRIFVGGHYEKPIEQRTVRPRSQPAS